MIKKYNISTDDFLLILERFCIKYSYVFQKLVKLIWILITWKEINFLSMFYSISV